MKTCSLHFTVGRGIKKTAPSMSWGLGREETDGTEVKERKGRKKK